MSYKAFISYSHAADGQLAPSIQSALHRFAKPWYRLRAVNVFRDKSSLSASPGLWPSIEQALTDSEFFLLCASPASASSKWVRQEVQWWLSHRTADKMLILLTEGELVWDSDVTDFDWTRTTSIAPGLSKQFRDEPLFVDLRWARQADNLSLRHSQFRGAILDIAAPLHGRPKDELDGEDVRQHRRTRLISAAAVLGILLFAIAAMWQAYEAIQARDAEAVQRQLAEQETIKARNAEIATAKQRDIAIAQRKIADEKTEEARREKAEAVRQRDRAIAALLQNEAERLSRVDGQWDVAALLAVESLRKVENPGTYGLLSKLFTSGPLPSARLLTQGGGSVVAFSPDGKLVATGDYDGLIVVRAAGGRPILRAPHGHLLRTVRFTPSGHRIVAATDDHIRVFEVPEGRVVAELSQGSSNAVLEFSRNGRFLARAEGARAWLRDAENLRELAAADHTEPITVLGIADDGSFAALASQQEATLVDVRTGGRRSLRVPNGIAAVTFSPDGKFAAFDASAPQVLPTVFDTAEAKEQPQMSQAALGWFGPDRWYSLAPNRDSGLVQVFDRRQQVIAGFLRHSEMIGPIQWSRDGELLAIGAGNDESSTTVFQTSSWQRVARFKFQGKVSVRAVAISPQGDRIASTWDRGTVVFHPYQGGPFASLPSLDPPKAITVSEAGNMVAARYAERVLFMKPGNPAPVAQFDGCRLTKFSAMAATGARFVVRCGDGTARVIDPTGRNPAVSIPHTAAIDPTLSPDGKLVFAVTPEGDAVLDSARGNVLKRLGSGAGQAAISADKLHVAVASSDRGLELHELRGARPPKVLRDNVLIESLSFSRDGRLLAAGERNRFAYVYDVASGKLLAKLDHKEEETQVLRIQPVVFSPSGRRLASLTRDPTFLESERAFTLHVFDLSTRDEIIRAALNDLPRGLRFSPDEEAVEIAFGSRNLRLERFPLGTAELLQSACARVGRNLDETEWERYMPGERFRRTCAAINPAARVIR